MNLLQKNLMNTSATIVHLIHPQALLFQRQSVTLALFNVESGVSLRI
jgi:hypothetical protein